MANGYDEYLQILKTNFKPAIKLEWLNPDGTPYGDLTNEYVDMSGTLTIGMENGTRRTATISIDNSGGMFSIEANGLWYGRMIKLWMGVHLSNGDPYYFPQGVFYVTSIQETNSPELRQLVLTMTDKWCMLDGTMWGNLDGIYLVPINTNIYEGIETLLMTSRYTGQDIRITSEPKTNAIDCIAPMFTSYYVNKTYTDNTVDPPKVWRAILTPYEIRAEYGKTYADILLEYAKQLGAYIYYDVDGRLTIEPTQDDISDASKPILWTFKPTEQEFMNEDSVHDFTSFYNDIIVVGFITNGIQPIGRAQNINASSPTSIQIAGIKTHPPYQDSAYYTNKQCEELAKYYLKMQTIKQRAVTIESAPMYHLRENRLIQCIRPYSTVEEPLLISNISLPIGTTGSMTITATSVNEFNFDASVMHRFIALLDETMVDKWTLSVSKNFISSTGGVIDLYFENDGWTAGQKKIAFQYSAPSGVSINTDSNYMTPSNHIGVIRVNVSTTNPEGITGDVIIEKIIIT